MHRPRHGAPPPRRLQEGPSQVLREYHSQCQSSTPPAGRRLDSAGIVYRCSRPGRCRQPRTGKSRLRTRGSPNNHLWCGTLSWVQAGTPQRSTRPTRLQGWSGSWRVSSRPAGTTSVSSIREPIAETYGYGAERSRAEWRNSIALIAIVGSDRPSFKIRILEIALGPDREDRENAGCCN